MQQQMLHDLIPDWHVSAPCTLSHMAPNNGRIACWQVVQECAKQPDAVTEHLGMAPVQGIAQREHHVAGGHGPQQCSCWRSFPVVAAVSAERSWGCCAPQSSPLPPAMHPCYADMASWHRVELSTLAAKNFMRTGGCRAVTPPLTADLSAGTERRGGWMRGRGRLTFSTRDGQMEV